MCGKMRRWHCVALILCGFGTGFLSQGARLHPAEDSVNVEEGSGEMTTILSPSDLINLTLVITAYNELAELHVDGVQYDLPHGNNWSHPDYVPLPRYTRLVAIRALNLGTYYCGGILASAGSFYLLTDYRFKCMNTNPSNWDQLGFDDSGWSFAAEYGTNGGGHTGNCPGQSDIPDINPNAWWIWTYDITDQVVSCRGYTPLCDIASPCLNNGVCLKNDVKLCNCPYPYTGEICENAICEESTCQNGGSCNPDNNPLCSCLPGFTGHYCETFLDLKLTVTAKTLLYELYVDGVRMSLSHMDNVSYPDVIDLQAHNQLIAVTALDTSQTCAGILASVTEDYLVTDVTWKCMTEPPPEWYTLGYDDGDWSDAYIIGPNHDAASPPACSGVLPGVPSISQNASWIWTPSILDTPEYDDIVHCRAYLPTCDRPSTCLNGGRCNRNNVTLCSCLPGFTGTFCEFELSWSMNITAKSVIYELYIDGVRRNLTHNDEFQITDEITLTATNRLIAVLAADSSQACAGILASVTDDFLVTDSTWKCRIGPPPRWYQFEFDDSDWPSAYVIGPNDNVTWPEACRVLTGNPSVSKAASWIWTSTIPDTPYYDSVIHCRAYMPICESIHPCQNGGTCNRNNATLCTCPEDFGGIYCELPLNLKI